MPHTNSRTSTASKRKNAKPVHTKRLILEDDEGWAHVVGGKTHTSRATLNVKTEKGDFSIGQFQYMNKTIEELQKEYGSAQKNWQKSSACAELIKLLTGNNVPTIDNVVVFGLGTFQAVEAQHSRTSLTQLCALQTILRVLNPEIPVIQQDPAFTDHDKEFLSTFKHTVASDPKGYAKVTKKSLVYAIHCYPDVYDGIRKAATPAMLIGNNLKGEEPTAFNNLEKFQDLQDLYNDLEVTAQMPQFGNAFSSTVIFTRKEASEEENMTVEGESLAQEVKADEVAALVGKLEI